MSYDIEMLWECSICHHRGNRGLADRYCCNCGHKKDETDSEYMPDDMSERAALSGEASKKAAAGPDWVCRYCDSNQNQLNQHCGNCGGDKEGTRLVSPRQAEQIAVEVREDFAAAKRTTEEIGRKLDEYSRQKARGTFAPVAAESAPRLSWYRFWLHRFVVRFAIALAIIAVGGLGWRLFMPHQVIAKVSALSWQHDTVIDRYQVWQREGWYPEGGSFDTVPLGPRHHHYDRVHVGSHREPYQDRYSCGETCSISPIYTTCSSNKNGTARCTKHGGTRSCSTKYCYRTAYRTVEDYENVSRSQMWFTWKIWDWGYNRTVSRAGHSRETIWPDEADLHTVYLNPGEEERSSRQSKYQVTFKDSDGEAYNITPRTHEEFMRYDVGDLHRLRVVLAGSVEVLP